MRTGKLTSKEVDSILAGRNPKRYHGDGGGLWLIVWSRDPNGRPQAASWVFRYMLDGKNREMGSARHGMCPSPTRERPPGPPDSG
jgi:hypothetical protein